MGQQRTGHAAVNCYTSESNGSSYNSLYAGVNAGVNVGAWYLRHNGSYSRMGDGESQYNNINTYLQRDIPALKARVLLGQSNTTGQLFNTVPFTGVQLATDERMLPESLRGYAPDIRGIARTNARVTVRQSGQVLYETTVTSGEFLINDLYALVPYLNPYQMNEISLDPAGTAANVEMDNTSQKVAPYSGAVVKVKYTTRQGTPILVNATYQGEPVPFGADIFDSQGNSVGSVGQGGQLYARVTQDKGQLRVKWGEGGGMQCTVSYLLMPVAKGQQQTLIQQFNSPCTAVTSATAHKSTLAKNEAISAVNPG